MTRPALRVLLFFVAISGLSFGRQAEAQAPVFLYAAKFVVGNGDGRILAKGQYFTAINVHNPTRKTPAKYQKRFAIGLPSETAGKVVGTTNGSLNPDLAMEIDTLDIHRHTSTNP